MATDAQKEQLRFEVELEFVQCLSDPQYLNHLASTLVFEDERVVGYLKYLTYWKKPEYAKFIRFPHCLYFLDLLQDKTFRENLKSQKFAETIAKEQYFHWLYLNGKVELTPEQVEAKRMEEEFAVKQAAAVEAQGDKTNA